VLKKTLIAAALLGAVFTPVRDSLPLAAAAAAGGDPVIQTLVGLASYYGPGFHGRLTASGEVFDMHELVAAHRTLPLGTVARVTNLANGRSVVVRITDRGPYIKGRILDVSKGAAQALAFVRDGLTRVRIEILAKTTNPRRQSLQWRHATSGASRPPAAAGIFERTRR
jgi:rare lipoprotein A